MGGCEFKFKSSSDDKFLSLKNFELISVVGHGGFGKVYKARWGTQIIALKIMSKAKVIQKKSVASVMNELSLLQMLKHQFIINVIHAFQDRFYLYLSMDFMGGGDLRFHLCKFRKFNEVITKHIVICIVIGLDYVHSNGVIHRDIKPENLVFDGLGYLRITDFGIARIWKPQNSTETSGTPGYMAPEVMCRQNHGVAVDYYALGIILFECIIGKRPYNGKSRQEIRDQIISKQAKITEVPPGWTPEAIDLCNQLIQRKPNQRLGYNGPDEVKDHAWFKGVDWHKYANKEVPAVYIPDDSLENYMRDMRRVTEEDQQMLFQESVQLQFTGYEHQTHLTMISPPISQVTSPRRSPTAQLI